MQITSLKKNLKINKQGMSISPVKLCNDVWIGAGSKILRGSYISKGCIIGANSVTLEKTITKEFEIYAGTPARLIGRREK